MKHRTEFEESEIQKKYLSPHEVAHQYGICIETLKSWRWSKKGPRFYKLGRLVKYRRDHVEKYIETKAVLTKDDH